MRIGILTDIHGDVDSLGRVLARLEALHADRVVCLGDLVVHGPDSNAVVDFFRARPEIVVVKGNHDIGASVQTELLEQLHFFSPDSRMNTLAAREALSPENKAYLDALPLVHVEGGLCFTHAAPDDPFAIMRHPERLRAMFEQMPTRILFAGHTHRTRVHHWPRDKAVWCSHHPAETRTWTYALSPLDRYIINLGCTAQLKFDSFPPICAIFDPDTLQLAFSELPDLR